MKKMYVEKKHRKYMKIVGCFWTWQKDVFSLFFGGFNGFVVCCVFGKVAKC